MHKKFDDKYVKKLETLLERQKIDAAKHVCKSIMQKNSEATGDLIGNKTVMKITSTNKVKRKTQAKQCQQNIDDLRLI